MFSSHNLRMLNPAVSQTPLLQNLQALVPNHFICSKTVKIRNYVWIDGYDQYIPQHEQERVAEMNQGFHQNGHLDLSFERKTEVVDPLMRCINVKIEDLPNSFASITPSPCCGLYDEVVKRESEQPYVMLSPQQIEFRPDRYLEHGRMIEHHSGILKTFNLPYFEKQSPSFGTPSKEEYVVVEFELNGFNVATGMFGVGLPPITLLGVFFNNFFEKINENLADIPFAVGIHSLQPMVSQTHIYRNTNHLQNNLRKANIKGYFIFKVENPDVAAELISVLDLNFAIAKTYVTSKKTYYTNSLPRAYWMKEMSSEIAGRLAQNPKKDALDIAFEFAAENRVFSPVSSGFALFNQPEEKPHMDNVRYHHSWAETVFSCTELVHGEFDEQYLYHRNYSNLFVNWAQK